MDKALDVATLPNQRIIQHNGFLRIIAKAYHLGFHVQVGLAELLHKLCVRQAFANDCMVAAIRRITVVDATEMDGNVSVRQRFAFIAGQAHAVNDLQRQFYDTLIALAAIKQIFPDAIFQMSDADISADAENLSPAEHGQPGTSYSPA